MLGEHALQSFRYRNGDGSVLDAGGRAVALLGKVFANALPLPLVGRDKGYQLVHAAAVGSEAGAVLISGKGGLGKSTTALSCLGKGLTYVGDSHVVVQLDPFPRVHSLTAQPS